MAGRAEKELEHLTKKVVPQSYDSALVDIANAFSPREYKKSFKKSFDDSKLKTIQEIRGTSDAEKKRFKDTINSAVRKNDVIFKQLQKDFLDKENDPVSLWHLFKEAWSLLSVIPFDDKKKQDRIQTLIRSQFNIQKLNRLYDALIYQKEMNVWHSYGEMRSEFLETIDGNDGFGHMVLLSFVSSIFDDTEVAKETAPTEEEYSPEAFGEEFGE